MRVYVAVMYNVHVYMYILTACCHTCIVACAYKFLLPSIEVSVQGGGLLVRLTLDVCYCSHCGSAVSGWDSGRRTLKTDTSHVYMTATDAT